MQHDMRFLDRGEDAVLVYCTCGRFERLATGRARAIESFTRHMARVVAE